MSEVKQMDAFDEQQDIKSLLMSMKTRKWVDFKIFKGKFKLFPFFDLFVIFSYC
jgi:hypothetical protein